MQQLAGMVSVYSACPLACKKKGCALLLFFICPPLPPFSLFSPLSFLFPHSFSFSHSPPPLRQHTKPPTPPFPLHPTPPTVLHFTMIISTPKIGDLSDDNTLTMSNTLANALITADFSYSPQKNHKKTPSNSTNSTTTTNTTNTTSNTSENGPQPRTPATPATLTKPSRRTSTTGYVSRVGFDTLGCDTTSEYAFTLQSKTDGWSRSKHSRTFLVGTDLNDYSAHALHWVMENMVENGDEVRLFFYSCRQILNTYCTPRDCVSLEAYHWS